MVVPASPPNPEAPPVQNADEAEELAAGMDTPSATRDAPGWDGPVIATSTIPMPRATTATPISAAIRPRTGRSCRRVRPEWRTRLVWWGRPDLALRPDLPWRRDWGSKGSVPFQTPPTGSGQP